VKKKKMNARYIIIPIVILALLAALGAPASADESCWDDTFSDETGIEVKYNLTVADGNVTLAGGTGTDHNGASWTPANGAEISGVHYNISTFTVAAGTTVYVVPWSDGDDGFVEIYAATINIEGTLSGHGRGYPGGAGAGHYYHPNGSCWHPEYGTGDGGTHNKEDGAGQHPGGTEGYKLSAGGGGGHGNSGGKGVGYYCGMYGHDCSDGGDAYGTLDTKQATIGAGGAGAGGGYEGELPPPYKWGGDGGAGGASILLDATTITISGSGTATVNGEDGGDGEDGYKGTGGAGGGAGGSIVINAGTLSGSGSLYAEGGDGGDCGNGSSHTSGGGGGAAGGRIKVWYASSTFSGSYSVMNGSAGAGAATGYGYGGPGEPGSAGTYYSVQETYSPCTPGGSNYKPSGYLKSTVITPSSLESWSTFSANHTENVETNISYQILNATDDSTLCTITASQAAAGYDISSCADATDSIRLYADLNTTDPSNTPVLHDWTVCWIVTVVSPTPSTPFMIYGGVNDSAGDPVNDPNVTVTNLNTSEIYDVETNASFNYYQVLTCSDNVSIGDVLHFTAIAETTTESNHEVTAADMNRGGFEQNIIIEKTPRPDLVITIIDAYHNKTLYPSPKYPPCFNLSNEIDVTVENAGSKDANSSHVSLYIDSEFRGKQSVPALDVGCNATVQFKWTPEGYDCEDGGTSITYTLQAVADCDNELDESNEGNNESTVQETAYWAGYSADEVLSTAFHGTIHGGLNFTTGDGVYTSLGSPGASTNIHYNITLPAGASVELARLNVYYTWSKIDTIGVYPSMEVSITNASGGPYTLSTDKEYNDRPCDSPAITYDYPFGNYVHDITDYVNGSGSYTVTVKNNGPTEHSFAIDPPGLVILYNDSTKPEYEYWILEGADILQGGRRGGSGNLALSECINNATFEGAIDLNKMESATLGLATPWGGNPTAERHSYLYFNGNELGKDVYHGYGSQYSETLNGMSMHIGSTTAQMGVNLTDVTSCLAASNNVVGQGDGGDSMLVANAFLLVERVGEKKDDMAIAEETVNGNLIEGSYKNTTASDNDYEVIEEIVRGKKSLLEHKWTIDVTSGTKTNVTFYLEAHRGIDTDENDHFMFAYSTDGSTYTDMVEVNTTEDSNLTYKLPSDLSGTVYIRVKDTDRTNKNTKLDAIYVDHMFIRSVFGAPSYGVSAAIEPASQTVKPTDSTTYTVTVTNTGDRNASYTVNMSGTAVVNETITVSPLNWSTGMLTPGNKNITTVTVSTSNTPEETYTLTATATCVEDASVTDSDTSMLVVSSVTNTMHVVSIDMWYKKTGGGPKGADYRIYTKVKIVNSSDVGVAGAMVELNTTLPPDNSTNVSSSEVTGDDGTVEFMYGPTKTEGTYTSTVTNVTKYEWTYDPVANVVTSETLPVP